MRPSYSVIAVESIQPRGSARKIEEQVVADFSPRFLCHPNAGAGVEGVERWWDSRSAEEQRGRRHARHEKVVVMRVVVVAVVVVVVVLAAVALVLVLVLVLVGAGAGAGAGAGLGVGVGGALVVVLVS